jgi:hypothetical protein
MATIVPDTKIPDVADMVDWRKFIVISPDPAIPTCFNFPYAYFGTIVKQSFDKGQKVLLEQITRDLKDMFKEDDPNTKVVFHILKHIIEKANKNQATKAYWENTGIVD